MTSTSASLSVSTAPSGPPDRWTGRLVVTLIALIWPTQLLGIAGIVGANAIPGVAIHFHTTNIAWFGLVGSLVSTPLAPFVMKLGDCYGRRQLMLAMVGLGVVGDVIAATAGSFWLVLVGRGIAACYSPFAILAFPAVRDIFPPRLVRSATAYLGGSLAIVGLIAPFLAGWLINSWGFRGPLWFLAISTMTAFLLVAFLVPQTPRHDRRDGFDWFGGLVLAAGLTGVVYGIGQGQSWGWTSVATLSWVGAGAVALLLFLLVERSAANPIIDLKLFARRSVAVAATVSSFGQSVALTMAGMTILLATFPHIPGVSDGLGWTSWHNAEVGVSWNLMMIAAGYGTGRVLRRGDARLTMQAGLFMAALGFGLMAFFHSTTIELALTQCVAQIGMGICVAAGPVLIVGVVSADEQGQGTGISQIVGGVFSTVLSAVLFAVLTTTGTVVKGTAFYLDKGFTLVFAIGAVILLLILLLARFLPPLRVAEAGGVALESAAEPVL